MKPKNNSNELILTRVYNAPVEIVWRAWADPKIISQWWGPRGFSLTTKSKDLRPGGHWIYTMHGPDGVDYPNMTTYYTVEPFKRLEYDHGATENTKPLFRVDVRFSEFNGQTTMIMISTFETPKIAKEMSGFIKMAGGTTTWDRLGEHLEKLNHNKDVFILNRAFEAPIDEVFNALTLPSRIEKWQPPTGFYMKIIEGQIEVGKSLFYEMGSADLKFYGRSTYQKINRPFSISFLQEFCTENGATAKHPGAPVWPAKWQTSIELSSEELNITRLTLTSEIIDQHTTHEREAFIAARGGMTQGWTGSLDRLEELLLEQN